MMVLTAVQTAVKMRLAAVTTEAMKVYALMTDMIQLETMEDAWNEVKLKETTGMDGWC